ncbi:moonshiner [Drosophila elegans]|uniref:moonshiner n=1 Tax=Drosophila elegans TaxID=30023 RepID=UPI0007E850F8|nr:moonshiner [Drosophila elegans]
MVRSPKLKPSNDIWIGESCSFPGHVVAATMRRLDNDLEGLSGSERRSLGALKKCWMQKLLNRRPESNRRPPTPKKRRCRAPKSTQSAPGQMRMVTPPPAEDGKECNVFELEDNVMVKNRICIPRLASRWRLRYFEILMPAYVLKRGLLDEHFSWELMNQIMDATDDEGTAIFQQFVDDVVKDLSP